MSLQTGADFDGNTYVRVQDHKRLTTQLGRVYSALYGGRWRTLDELSSATGSPQASISARLRDLRKAKFGAHLIERRPRGLRTQGLFEYRMVPQQLDWTLRLENLLEPTPTSIAGNTAPRSERSAAGEPR